MLGHWAPSPALDSDFIGQKNYLIKSNIDPFLPQMSPECVHVTQRHLSFLLRYLLGALWVLSFRVRSEDYFELIFCLEYKHLR